MSRSHSPAHARDAARALVMRHGWNAVSYQILNAGMKLWFAGAGDAVIGYATHARVRVVAGAPICDEPRLGDVAAEFERDAAAHRESVLYFAAGSRLEQLAAARTDSVIVGLGAQPIWDPQGWSGIVQHKASLRAQLHRAANKGVHVEEWCAQRARSSPALRTVLHDWLDHRGLPPLAFLVTPDILDQLDDRRIFVAVRDDTVIAYLVATPVPARDGWLVEQWPRAHSAPNGTSHALVDAAFRAFAATGSRYATLGLAPLSTRTLHELPEPHWLRLTLRSLRAHGRRFYNFQGLEAFKASLQPDRWEPIFAIARGDRFTPRMLAAVAGVFSGGSPLRLATRALTTTLRPSPPRN